MLRGCQVEVVDDVRDVGDAVLLRSSTSCCQGRIATSLVSHVLVALAVCLSLVEVLVVYILHACECILLLVVGGDVRGARLIQTASALESLVIGPVLLRCSLSLACAVLKQLVLVPQADHVLLFRLLHILVYVALWGPWIDQWLLVVG